METRTNLGFPILLKHNLGEIMGKSLSPRDAAEILGITTDTLRRWERDGLIQPERTPGGQRRYREEDVRAILNSEPASTRTPRRIPLTAATEAPAEPRDADDDQLRRTSVELPPWERRVNEERADLEVMKLRRERAAIVRAEHADREERQRLVEERRRDAERRDADAAAQAAREQSEQRRLEGLRTHGRMVALMAPPEYQAKVARDLASSVNANDYPAEMGDFFARQQVAARVESLLKPWRDSQTREREKVESQRKIESLVSTGKRLVSTATQSWNERDYGPARRQFERELRQEVEADWTEDDVRDFVDEFVAEWEEG